jgi:hypothetical protein
MIISQVSLKLSMPEPDWGKKIAQKIYAIVPGNCSHCQIHPTAKLLSAQE